MKTEPVRHTSEQHIALNETRTRMRHGMNVDAFVTYCFEFPHCLLNRSLCVCGWTQMITRKPKASAPMWKSKLASNPNQTMILFFYSLNRAIRKWFSKFDFSKQNLTVQSTSSRPVIWREAKKKQTLNTTKFYGDTRPLPTKIAPHRICSWDLEHTALIQSFSLR